MNARQRRIKSRAFWRGLGLRKESNPWRVTSLTENEDGTYDWTATKTVRIQASPFTMFKTVAR